MEIENIQAILRQFSSIKLAYLFGSHAKGTSGPLSDYDIAIYLDEKDEKQRFNIRLQLMHVLSKALKREEVDVVILNDIESPLLKYEIIKAGKLLYVEEPFQILIEPRIFNEYFDFRDSLASYYD